MSAKALLCPTGGAAPLVRTPRERIWEASLRALADTFAQDVPLDVRLETGCAELSLNANAGPNSQTLDDRESLIQCGTALFHLRLSLQRFGRLGHLQLFPDLDHLSLVARISGEFDREPAAALEGLSETKSETIPAKEVPLSEQVLAKLAAAGTSRKAWLDFSQCEASRNQLCKMAASTVRPLRPGSGHSDQVLPPIAPPGSTRMGAIKSALIHIRASSLASRLLGPAGRASHSPTAVEPGGEAKPQDMVALAVLKTKTDDRYGWLAAGEIIAQVRSEAATLNVSSQVFARAFREKQAREELRNLIGRKGFVQAILGFGS